MCWTLPNQSQRQSDASTSTACNLTEEVDAIVTVTKGFLSALETKSRDDFDKYCVKAGGMALWPPPPSVPRFCTIGAFVEHISKIKDDIDERMWDPEVKVHESANLAAVWAPFRAKINGVVDHVGVELFVLHKINGGWKVTGLADSCRRPTDDEKISTRFCRESQRGNMQVRELRRAWILKTVLHKFCNGIPRNARTMLSIVE